MRALWNLRRNILSWLGYPVPCRYISRQYTDALQSGYLIMEYIEGPDIPLLSEHWAGQNQSRNEQQRTNFFRDLSRIMLNLACIPFHRIGSLILDHQGIVQLENRPLNFRLQQLENKGVPTNIDRDRTFSNTEAYYSSLLSCHDNRILDQVNSILSQSDGRNTIRTSSRNASSSPAFHDSPLS